MTHELPLLDRISVASPCSADWNEMAGDDRVRHCGQCRLNVYNVAEMTRQEAEALIRSREGRLCLRFYRRSDGTILTKDCPVGLRAIQRRLVRAVAAIAGLLVALVTAPLLAGIYGRTQSGAFGPSGIFARWIDPNIDVEPVLGKVCIPPTPTTAPAPPALPAGNPAQ